MAVNRESAEGRPVSSGDAPKPADVAKTSAEPLERPGMKLFSVAGKVKEISAASLTLETKAKEYILDLTGAAIKIGVQNRFYFWQTMTRARGRRARSATPPA